VLSDLAFSPWWWVGVGVVGTVCVLQGRHRWVRAAGTTLILWIPLFLLWAFALVGFPAFGRWGIVVGMGDSGSGRRGAPPPWPLFDVWFVCLPLLAAALITTVLFRRRNGRQAP